MGVKVGAGGAVPEIAYVAEVTVLVRPLSIASAWIVVEVATLSGAV